MPDVLTPEQRRRNMQHIRAKDTKPEILVRKWLFAHGIRYRKNDRRYPGTPDIVIPNGRIAVFVNGCFWHRHEGCRYFVIPKTRSEWWIEKIARTQARDVEKTALLRQLGWHVITVWECQTKRDFNRTMEVILEEIMSYRNQRNEGDQN